MIMTSSNLSPPRRRTTITGVAVATVLVTVLPVTSHAHAAQSRSGSCPPAESLVPGTTWHNHTLTRGVTLSEGSKRDPNGLVKMHVLRIATTTKGLYFRPLKHAIARRTPLSKLAAGRKHLVAAVNTGYFDFFTGAPLDPLINRGAPLVMSSHHQPVVGIGSTGLWQSGDVWLAAAVYAGGKSRQLNALNETRMPTGLGAYTSAWGSARVPMRSGMVARPVVSGKVQAPLRRFGFSGVSVPSGGYLLVGRGSLAANWLSGLRTGTAISVAATTRTSAAHRFVQGYGVGTEIVQRTGVVRTGLSCSSANTKQPARTAIGFLDGGKKLVIAEVEDHPGTWVHGLDEDQMSKLMVQLGVTRAFLLDGSGSTEMLARMPKTGKVSLRTYPADGVERPMPVGLGIMSRKIG
jgi:hypothetical protein